MNFPADLQNLVDTAIADRARAAKGVAAIASANAAMDIARKAVEDANQMELDATNAASQSEPAAVAGFLQWLRAEGDAAATPAVVPVPVDPAPAPAEPTPADPTQPTE